MAFDSYLAERIDRILEENKVSYHAKKMMGGLCYMVDDKMCLGIVKDHLMCRVGVDAYEECLAIIGARPMDFTGRPMKGYVFVAPEGIDLEDDLEGWIQRCLAHNPFAKASKKKKKS